MFKYLVVTHFIYTDTHHTYFSA